MKFKDIKEGKLYRNKDFANVYTVKDGLLYHMGITLWGQFEPNMYYVTYAPAFILGMEFEEIKLIVGGGE